MFTAATRYLARRSATSSLMATTASTTTLRSMASLADHFKDYGKLVFTGKVADSYLQSHGASADLLKDPTWVNHSSDIVAAAVFDWYVHDIRVKSQDVMMKLFLSFMLVFR
jgi:hypothetical protein